MRSICGALRRKRRREGKDPAAPRCGAMGSVGGRKHATDMRPELFLTRAPNLDTFTLVHTSAPHLRRRCRGEPPRTPPQAGSPGGADSHVPSIPAASRLPCPHTFSHLRPHIVCGAPAEEDRRERRRKLGLPEEPTEEEKAREAAEAEAARKADEERKAKAFVAVRPVSDEGKMPLSSLNSFVGFPEHWLPSALPIAPASQSIPPRCCSHSVLRVF
eukprot:360235-Chlamydomonas_euryale.AAC.1